MKQYKRVFEYLGEYKKTVGLVILLTVLQVAGNVSLPRIMAVIIDVGIKNRDIAYLAKMGGLMIGVTILTCFIGVLASRKAETAASGLGNNLRVAMMEKLCSFTVSDVNDFTKASFINRMTADVTNVRDMLSLMLGTMVSAPITIIFIIAMSLRINKSLSLIFLIAVPLFSFTAFLIVKYARPYYKKNAHSLDVINRVLLEDLINIRLIKGFVREDYESRNYRDAAGDVKKYGMRAEQITNTGNPVQQLVVNLCVIFLLWFGGQKIMSGSIQVGELFSFITYANQILYQVTLISMVIVPIIGSVVSVERVIEVLDKEPAVSDETADKDAVIEDGSIKFNHVYFDYSSDKDLDEMLISDIDLEIKDKEAIGIIGATGAGKSTLVNLIPRLFDVSSGSITVGGKDIREISFNKLRKEIAFTPQKSILFSGSLRENLMSGNSNVSNEELIGACKEACIYDYVESHDDGFETHIEEGGSNVSGGQRQRLCLARAMVKNCKILIMDDCTSALDKATERAVMDHIIEDFSDRTRILISSKISSIKRMDRIVVIDKGRISGVGTHDELLAENAVYRDFCVSQGEA